GGREGGVVGGGGEGVRGRPAQSEHAVIDRRQPAVGIDREIVRLAGAGRTDLERNMLVFELELLGDPEHAKGAGAGNPVNAQGGHREPHSTARNERLHGGATAASTPVRSTTPATRPGFWRP